MKSYIYTLLITGGAGFIGSNFIIYLMNKYPDYSVINLDILTYAGNLENLSSIETSPNYYFIHGDIADKKIVQGILTNYSINAIVNFAAESHVDRSIADPEIFIRTNVMGTACLLEAARSAWTEGNNFRCGKKFLQVSTDEVYGSLGDTGYFTETTPLSPRSPYSASKASADLIVKSYYETYGLPVNITRCSNNYGPRQLPEKLIPLVISNALKMKSIPLYGDGLNIRDWLYVNDHCKAIDLVLHKGKPGETYNIGGHNEKTNLNIIKEIIHYLQKNYNSSISEELIKFVEDRKGHDRRYGIDPSKIMTELGWVPDVNFETGIEKTILWYLENQL